MASTVAVDDDDDEEVRSASKWRVAVKLIIISAESKIKCKQLKWAWMDSTMRRAVGEFAIPNTGDGADVGSGRKAATSTATSFSTHTAAGSSISNSSSKSNNNNRVWHWGAKLADVDANCVWEREGGSASARGGLVCKTSERSQTICVEWRPLATGAVFVFAHHYFQHAHTLTHTHSQATHTKRKVDTFASKCFNCSLPKWRTHTHMRAGWHTHIGAGN